MRRLNRNQLLPQRILYTLGIMFVYMFCRRITLFGADLSYYIHADMDAEQMLAQTIGGDIRKISVFALGISPYMIASIVMMMITAVIRANSKSRISMKNVNKITVALTLGIAVIQACLFISDMHYDVTREDLVKANIASATELVAGSMMIYWLITRNKEHGIGQQTALILINIQESIYVTLTQSSLRSLLLPLSWSLIGAAVMLVMENTELRVPVQRISIHNVYADKNYQAFKLNPIGTMPVMFAMAFFSLVQILLQLLKFLLRDIVNLQGLTDAMALTRPFGIFVFLLIIYVLNLVFSLITINPSEMAENFLKNGDCISSLRSGADTKRYLKKVIINLSLLSSTVMGICVGVPLLMQLGGTMDASLSMLPTSVMLLTGLYVTVYRELETLHSFDSYKTFL